MTNNCERIGDERIRFGLEKMIGAIKDAKFFCSSTDIAIALGIGALNNYSYTRGKSCLLISLWPNYGVFDSVSSSPEKSQPNGPSLPFKVVGERPFLDGVKAAFKMDEDPYSLKPYQNIVFLNEGLVDTFRNAFESIGVGNPLYKIAAETSLPSYLEYINHLKTSKYDMDKNKLELEHQLKIGPLVRPNHILLHLAELIGAKYDLKTLYPHGDRCYADSPHFLLESNSIPNKDVSDFSLSDILKVINEAELNISEQRAMFISESFPDSLSYRQFHWH